MKKKILLSGIIVAMVLAMFCNYEIQARTREEVEERMETERMERSDLDFDGIVSQAQSFLDNGDSTKISTEDMQAVSNTIYNVLLTIGVVIAFIAGAILGIKFITSGLEGKADVKQMLVPYIIGLVVLFGAFTIWRVTLNILQSNTLSGTTSSGVATSTYSITKDNGTVCNSCGSRISLSEVAQTRICPVCGVKFTN